MVLGPYEPTVRDIGPQESGIVRIKQANVRIFIARNDCNFNALSVDIAAIK
jgi:hypothetical protein